ncbi:polymer biosynthesis protein, WecB/TagA/CpsF family [Parasphingorhabdus marina DSM 22363]|uniref:Polymer biosynthesis protein, WecB/TagA/CpsF family n=1 Tax=Parasphingorhabdus marina DSM 22363 TaxID=1123272 RepID=A0A1N6CPS8_9SPHN|nr:WecB/TagA/CpsF family glycosyltransferase [Parasphingorhabdus marina]SIN60455.1 polymer biosynthesis protein, WecB/TagA/CpsF family [Parasphingorhabdus marina DSM 22363]
MKERSEDAVATVRFLDVDILPIDLTAALDRIGKMASADRFSYVVTPNVDHMVNLHPKEPGPHLDSYREAYDSADLTLCDSRILKALARFSGLKLTLVPGSDLTAALFRHRLGKGDKVAIVGGDEELLEKLRQLHPRPSYSQHVPPMGVLRNPGAMADICRFVEASNASHILFAIGSPQSEIIARQCQQAGTCRGVGLCIGASLEFITSAKRRAPQWMQSAGLEWAFRLLSEPRRLWRRYLVDDMRIFPIYLRDRFGSKSM